MSTIAAWRDSRRRRWLVDPPFQYRFIGVMLTLLLLLGAGALGSVYLALWVTLRTFGASHEPLAVAQMTMVGLLVTFELLLIAPLVILVGLRLTHRVVGPLVRISRAVRQMAEGDFAVHLKLRRGDALVELADAVNALAASLRSRNA